MLSAYKPSPTEVRYVENGRGFLNMTAAFWAALLYNELPIVYTHDVPLAATDGHSCFINPTAMLKLGWTIENLAFVKGHEVLHYVLGHMIMGTRCRKAGFVPTSKGNLKYVHSIANIAMDLVINALLIKARVGVMPKEGLYDPRYSKEGMESWMEVYAMLFEDGGGREPDYDGFDQHLEPSEADQHADEANGEAKRSLAIASAAQTAAAAGQGDNLPAAIKRIIRDVLTPQVHWADHLRATMERTAGSPALDWRKVNRRMITRPDRIVYAKSSKFGCGPVVIGWDTSGSTGKWQDTFFAHMAGIIAELNPSEIYVVRCDRTVHDADQFSEPSDLNELRTKVNAEGIGGGGGTAFAPVFEWIEDNGIEPDMVIYLTDLLGSFPAREPNYPVIWADILGMKKPPFGQVVKIA